MSVDLEAIHRALAAQIREHVEEDTNVYPFPMGQRVMPCITVYPGDGDYVEHFKTLEAAGNLFVRIKVEVDAAEGESSGIKMCRYLSKGTGNGSSVFDAIHLDTGLGGAVDSCTALTAEWADPDTDPGVAWIPVEIYMSIDGGL